MRQWLEALGHLIFPPKCIFCGALTVHNPFHCGCPLETAPNHCPICGLALETCICHFAFQAIITPFVYHGAIKQAVIRLKTSPKKAPFRFFASQMTQVLTRQGYSQFDAVIPVPMRESDYVKRPVDQAGALANIIAKEQSCIYLPRLLIRNESSLTQHTLNKQQRCTNASKSYGIAKTTSLLTGQHVLLVDDICTTGATLHSCAELLHKLGAVQVTAVTACAIFL